MKSPMPVIASVVIVAVVAAAWWYVYSQFLHVPVPVTQTTSTSSLTGAAVNAAADLAQKSTTDLKKYGEIPVSAGGLPRNPSPLFGSGQ